MRHWWGDADMVRPSKKGLLVDVLVHTGGIRIYRCKSDRRALIAFWAFVAAALIGCVAGAF